MEQINLVFAVIAFALLVVIILVLFLHFQITELKKREQLMDECLKKKNEIDKAIETFNKLIEDNPIEKR